MSPIPLPPGRLTGRIRIPGSKSVTNRALVAAALAEGESVLLDPLDADDTRVLADALGTLGARVSIAPGAWTIAGPLSPPTDREVTLDVGPAGTPARFLLALLSALPGRFVLDGSARMRERPMGPLVDALRRLGARIEPLGTEGFLPLRILGGSLHAGRVAIRGDVSSQFLSALELVSPLVGGIGLDVEGPLVSEAYLTLTARTRAAFGVEAGAREGRYRACRYRVPGDDSAACFAIAGAVLSAGDVEILGLERGSAQPDAVLRSWAAEAGAQVTWRREGEADVLRVRGTGVVRPLAVDVDPAPDAALPLAAMLAFAGGTSRLWGVARLREKESDRLAAAVDLLTRAGAAARIDPEGPILVIDGARGVPRPAAFEAHDDHRVAMSAAVLALVLPPGSTLDAPGVTAKSYPAFFEDWSALVRPAAAP